MQDKQHIAFYGNSSVNIGAGHIMRLFALAQAASEHFAITFLYKQCIPTLLSKLADEGFKTKAISSPLNKDELFSVSCDVIVVDDYELSKEEWQCLRQLGCYLTSTRDKKLN